jgi:chaperonin cofactor prefoldin
VGVLERLRAELATERERREAAELRAAVSTREVELLQERVGELREILRAALDRPPWWERLARAMRGGSR